MIFDRFPLKKYLLSPKKHFRKCQKKTGNATDRTPENDGDIYLTWKGTLETQKSGVFFVGDSMLISFSLVAQHKDFLLCPHFQSDHTKLVQTKWHNSKSLGKFWLSFGDFGIRGVFPPISYGCT